MKRIAGIALIVAGAGLAYWGYTESQTIGAQLTEAISGSPDDNVMFKYIGGAVAIAVGAFLSK